MKGPQFRSVVITGASSGIGAALAERFACEGARLGLIGRNTERLEEVARVCRSKGAALVEIKSLDVRDFDALSAWILKFNLRYDIDLLVANAGVTGGWSSKNRPESHFESQRIIDTNVNGALGAVQAILPSMLSRGKGQIGVISSIAALVPLRGLPSYCASKAALLAYGLALRETVRDRGVGVTTVCPGFVDTPLLRQLSGSRPVELSPTVAAEKIFKALIRNNRVVSFPTYHAFVTRVLALLPPAIVRAAIPAQTVKPLA